VTDQAAFAATLVDEWVRAGVTDVVVAPGSRSTPLVLAADAAPVRVHVHLDERSAAFYALGIGLATGRPAPVIVTSGTAAVELHPAVVEAHHAGVPMLVCTADRPPELHGVGAQQTIDQRALYGDVLRWRADLGAGDLPPSAWRSIGARAVAAALAGPGGPGPVHLNLAFRDPLVAVPGAGVPPGRPGGRPWHTVERGDEPAAVINDLAARRGVIVAGAGAGAGARAGAGAGARAGAGGPAALASAAAALGWPVLAAPVSGYRGLPGAVAAFDAILRHGSSAEALRPEVVLHLGAPPASKVLAAWLASIDEHVLVDPFGRWADPDRVAARVVGASPAAVCRALARDVTAPVARQWSDGWASAESVAQRAIDGVIARHDEPTEPGVARTLTAALRPEDLLFVASSMPVRDVEWYGAPGMRCAVAANRGANGIDGLVSTSLGLAAARRDAWTVALLGDLALLHDAGGLLGAARRGVDCCYVVVDNDGGGIFGFLPQAALPAEQFERLWGTPHGIDLSALAAVHGIPTAAVGRADALTDALDRARAAGGVHLLHVRTDRAANLAVHDELVTAVARALG